jgi:hypothetical protein
MPLFEGIEGHSLWKSEEERNDARIMALAMATPEIKAIADAVDGVIAHRLDLDGLDMLVRTNIVATSYEELVKAICLLKETKHITRIYGSRKDRKILLVLDGCSPIKVTLKSAGDASLPALDFDDGFVGTHGQSVPAGMRDAFLAWSARFKETKGASWNDPILSVDDLKNILNA